MKALIWKELRENFWWALLAMVALGAGELFALHYSQNPRQMDFFFYDGMTLGRKPFLIVTTFGCAFVGLGLGLLQVLPELKRDRWAALLHRPLARGRFFWGKAIAGVLLYLLATGGPLLVSVWHVATPGNFNTPFVPGMCQPAVADLLTGLSYYFAGLLLALEGGPLALRALPLLAAAHLTFFTGGEKAFRTAVAGSLAMALVLAVAGWGALLARDGGSRRTWLPRLAFLIVAFYGACGAGLLLQAVGGMAGLMGRQEFSAWEVLDNGEPACSTYVDQVITATVDAQGKPFTDANYRPGRIRSHLLGMNLACWHIDDTRLSADYRHESSYRESNNWLYPLRPGTQGGQWFYLWREGAFVGISTREKKAFALLGKSGFAPPNAHVPGFSELLMYHQLGDSSLLVTTTAALHYADLSRREWKELALPAAGPIYGSGYCWANTEAGTVDFVGVALRTGVAVYDAKGELAAMLPHQHDVRQWGQISVSVLKSLDRFVVLYQPNDSRGWMKGGSLPSFVDQFDAQGRVLASYTLAPTTSRNPTAWSTYVARRLQSPAFFFGEMLYRRLGAALGSSRLREALETQLGRRWEETRGAALVLLPVSVLLAALTFAWARRAQLPPRAVWAWTLGVLAFGLAGFVVFWLAGGRPRAIPCPTCGHARRIDREACAHCGAAWPEQATDGTEIIDRNPPVAASAIA